MTTRKDTQTKERMGSDERARTAQGANKGTEPRQETRTTNAQPGDSRSTGSGQKTAMSQGTTRPADLLPAMFVAPPGLLASAFLRNPREFMGHMQNEMDRTFASLGLHQGAESSSTSTTVGGEGRRAAAEERSSRWAPTVELFRRGSEFIVHAELPGLQSDDIDIRVQDDTLIISGERKYAYENQQDGFYRSERSYGSFYRALPLPEGVEEDQISASFTDGVLEVRVPIPERAERGARKIPIS